MEAIDRKWSTMKQQLADNGPTQLDPNQQREEAQNRVFDAANELMGDMGCAAFCLPGRHGNGLFIASGTREEILSLLGLEPAGTIDRPCDPAWYARLECKPDTQLDKGETIYRVKVGHENQPG